MQLLSPLLPFLFDLQGPLYSNFILFNFIFTFKVNATCEASYIVIGSLSAKLFLNLIFWGPTLADLNPSLSSTISPFSLEAATVASLPREVDLEIVYLSAKLQSYLSCLN